MTALYKNRALADAATEKLKIYAQPQRLMILSCLLSGERTVSEIDSATSIGQPALSQQLAELRRAEMVKSRRVSKQVYYDLANDMVGLCVRSMEAILGGSENPEAQLKTALAGHSEKTQATHAPAGTAQFARITR